MKTPNKNSAKSKISSKYQIVLPKSMRMILRDSSPGTSVYITAIDKDNLKVSLKPRNWAEEVKGLTKGAYGDANRYLKEIRESWEDRY